MKVARLRPPLMSNVRRCEMPSKSAPRLPSVFGGHNLAARCMLGLLAGALWFSLLFVFVGHLFEEAIRLPPRFGELIVVQGTYLSQEQCSGKGPLKGIDLHLQRGSELRTVRVPCMQEFTSLQPGTPLRLHIREVSPRLSWPPYTDLWHASMEGRVLYSYEARLSRSQDMRWIGYAVAIMSLLILGPIVWVLSKAVLREAGAKSSEP